MAIPPPDYLLAWSSMMPVTITAYPRSTNSSWGEPSWSATKRDDYLCRREQGKQRITTSDGRTIVPKFHLIVAGTDITETDKITMGGVDYQIDYLVVHYDESGPHHIAMDVS